MSGGFINGANYYNNTESLNKQIRGPKQFVLNYLLLLILWAPKTVPH